ncbi:MAG: protein MpaA [Phycisphaerales bacterium]|jgi:protein MpaA
MTLSALPPRIRHAVGLALLWLIGLLALATLPACSPTQSHPAPAAYTGVSRVGTPLPGEPSRDTRLASANALEFAGPTHDRSTDPASAFSGSSVAGSPAPGRRFRNMVGEPIPGLGDLPPINALTGTGPGLAAFAGLGTEIGLSGRGTPIHAIEFGPPHRPGLPGAMGPLDSQRVYLIGLIHGDEDEGYGAIGDVLAMLQSQAGPGLTVRVVPTMNPDGQTAGRRSNAIGVDLNRNWPASNFSPARRRGQSPASEPEVAAVLQDVRTFAPDLLIVFHSIATDGPFVNFDGPERAHDLARAFADAATVAGGGNWTVKPSMGYETPGSLGTWAGVDRQIPTLTVEFRTRQRSAEVSRAAVAGVRAVVGAVRTR